MTISSSLPAVFPKIFATTLSPIFLSLTNNVVSWKCSPVVAGTADGGERSAGAEVEETAVSVLLVCRPVPRGVSLNSKRKIPATEKSVDLAEILT